MWRTLQGGALGSDEEMHRRGRRKNKAHQTATTNQEREKREHKAKQSRFEGRREQDSYQGREEAGEEKRTREKTYQSCNDEGRVSKRQTSDGKNTENRDKE